MSGFDALESLGAVIPTHCQCGHPNCSINADRAAAQKALAAVAKLVTVLREVNECAAYWSEYDVPIGIHDRIKSALAAFGGSDGN